MKTILFSFAFLLMLNAGLSQTIPTDSLYLGQTPPGDSAIVFAPGTISLPNRRETKIVFSPNNEECLIGIGINNTFQILYTDFYSGYWTVTIPAGFITINRPIEPFFYMLQWISISQPWIKDSMHNNKIRELNKS